MHDNNNTDDNSNSNSNNNNNNHYILGTLRSIGVAVLPFRRRLPPPPCGGNSLSTKLSVHPNPSFPALVL